MTLPSCNNFILLYIVNIMYLTIDIYIYNLNKKILRSSAYVRLGWVGVYLDINLVHD
jgi:hypothetical protein